ncbi:hypothetical protein B0T26DRAFT_672625 [Lasiosphaeria miniovina]|uniref:C2H2-type domain-containing protein n=1 Tax=Lasiosphaeria miniovina TaxID=1954250 RepID=A0AA40E5N3_9PEZI|nr:uncharacterized protein B0T26DRAFT_672625 [Lasiosphaeria miniovina]KAK0728030.1 hypothetical protein B0T26DRAFT_672625 [Lasiosphaeria miniovina]
MSGVGLEDLIEDLIPEIAYSGENGVPVSSLLKIVRQYHASIGGGGNGNALLEGDALGGPQGAGQNAASVEIILSDAEMRSARWAWDWLRSRPQILVNGNKKWNRLDLDEVLALPEAETAEKQAPNAQTKAETGDTPQPSSAVVAARGTRQKGKTPKPKKATLSVRPRIHPAEDLVWQTLTRHGVDYKRVPVLEWKCLLGIASARAEGILQSDLRRLVDQDKRSLPKRTDSLAKKGYIVKRTIVVQKMKTSKLWLIDFAPPILEKDSGGLDLSPETLTKDLEPVAWHEKWTGNNIDIEALGRTFVAIVKAWGIIKYCDLRAKMGVPGKVWQMKTLAKNVQRVVDMGVLKYTAASFPGSGTRKVFKDCLKFMRDFRDEEWDRFLATGKKTSQYSDATRHREPKPNALVLYGKSEQDKEKKGQRKQRQRRICPGWTPEQPLAQNVFEVLQSSGLDGASNPQVSVATIGYGFRRYMASHLTKVAETQQPPHLKKFQVVSNLVRKGKTSAYMFSVPQAETAPDHDAASQAEGAGDKDRLDEAPVSNEEPPKATVADAYGFGNIRPKVFPSSKNASLADLCRLARKPHRFGRRKKAFSSQVEKAPEVDASEVPAQYTIPEDLPGSNTAKTTKEDIELPEAGPVRPPKRSFDEMDEEDQAAEEAGPAQLQQLDSIVVDVPSHESPTGGHDPAKTACPEVEPVGLQQPGTIVVDAPPDRSQDTENTEDADLRLVPEVYFGVPGSLNPLPRKRGKPRRSLVVKIRLEALKKRNQEKLPDEPTSSHDQTPTVPNTVADSMDIEEDPPAETILPASYNGLVGRLELSHTDRVVNFFRRRGRAAKQPIPIHIDKISESPSIQDATESNGKTLTFVMKEAEDGISPENYVFVFADGEEIQRTAAWIRREVIKLGPNTATSQAASAKPTVVHSVKPDVEPLPSSPQGQENPREGAPLESPSRGRGHGRGRRGRGGRRGGRLSSVTVRAFKSFKCDTCGGAWKNDIGLKYHQTKAQTPCNPDFTPESVAERALKRRRLSPFPPTSTTGLGDEDGMPLSRLRRSRMTKRGERPRRSHLQVRQAMRPKPDVDSGAFRGIGDKLWESLGAGSYSLSLRKPDIARQSSDSLVSQPASSVNKDPPASLGSGEARSSGLSLVPGSSKPMEVDTSQAPYSEPLATRAQHSLETGSPVAQSTFASGRPAVQLSSSGPDKTALPHANDNSEPPNNNAPEAQRTPLPPVVDDIQPLLGVEASPYPERVLQTGQPETGKRGNAKSSKLSKKKDKRHEKDENPAAVLPVAEEQATTKPFEPTTDYERMSTESKRRIAQAYDIINYLLDNSSGVFPGDKALFYAVTKVFLKEFRNQVPPTWKSYFSAVKALEARKEATVHTHMLRTERGRLLTCSLLMRTGVDPTSSIPTMMKRKMRDMWPNVYIPAAFSPTQEELALLQDLDKKPASVQKEEKEDKPNANGQKFRSRRKIDEIEVFNAPYYTQNASNNNNTNNAIQPMDPLWIRESEQPQKEGPDKRKQSILDELEESPVSKRQKTDGLDALPIDPELETQAYNQISEELQRERSILSPRSRKHTSPDARRKLEYARQTYGRDDIFSGKEPPSVIDAIKTYGLLPSRPGKRGGPKPTTGRFGKLPARLGRLRNPGLDSLPSFFGRFSISKEPVSAAQPQIQFLEPNTQLEDAEMSVEDERFFGEGDEYGSRPGSSSSSVDSTEFATTQEPDVDSNVPAFDTSQISRLHGDEPAIKTPITSPNLEVAPLPASTPVSEQEPQREPENGDAKFVFVPPIVIKASQGGSWSKLGTGYFRGVEEASFTMEGWMPDRHLQLLQNLPTSAEDMASRSKQSHFNPSSWVDHEWGSYYALVHRCATWEQSETGAAILSGGSIAPDYMFINFSSSESKASMKPIIGKWSDEREFGLDTLPYDDLDEDDDLCGIGYCAEVIGDANPRPAKKHRIPGQRKMGRPQKFKLQAIKTGRELSAYPKSADDFLRDPEKEKDDIDWTSENTRLAAFVVVTTLLGGVDRVVDWGLMMRLFPDLTLSQLRHLWGILRKDRQSTIVNLTDKFRKAFLKAYSDNEIPPLDFDNPLAYDWKRLIRWTINLHEVERTSLPASRKALERQFDVSSCKYTNREWREAYYHMQRSVFNKFQDATSEALAYPVDGNTKPALDTNLTVAMSWTRALCVTPVDTYTTEGIIHKRNTLYPGLSKTEITDLILKGVDQLQHDGIISKSTSKWSNGRRWRFNHRVLETLEKISHVDKVGKAVAFKNELDKAFRAGETKRVTYVTNDGMIMALLNMQACGRIRVKTTGQPNVPLGHEPLNYETRKYTKKYLHFRIDIVPTDTYLYNNDPEFVQMRDRIRNTAPPTAGPGGAIPAWCDVFGKVDTNRWLKYLSAALVTLAARGSMRAEELVKTLKPTTMLFEAELILDWGEKLGLLQSQLHGSTALACMEWWWIALEAQKEGLERPKPRKALPTGRRKALEDEAEQ